MKKTTYNNYNMPERDDKVKIDDLNQNTKLIDEDIAKLLANVNTKASLHSPVFSGEPCAPKPGTKDVFERIITTGVLADALEVEKLS